MRNPWLAIVLAFPLACGGGSDLGSGDKADEAGSCAGVMPGGQSPDGCGCDDDCSLRGDCCGDKLELLGHNMTFTTYNVGMHEAVGLVPQRRGPLVEALREEPSDVLCLQEVWADEDLELLRSELSDVYPFEFHEVTEDNSKSIFSCTLEVFDVLGMDSCRKDKCAEVSSFECIANEDLCASAWDELSSECQLCLSANTDSPVTSCIVWKGDQFANDGRNGLMLLSRYPIENAEYTEFDTRLIKRGVITADVAGTQVQCTHMTPELSRIPFPEGHETFRSWGDEHMAQVDIMVEASGDQCTVLLGDLNTGPQTERTTGELADNFAAIEEAGYEGTWPDAPCTHCAENPMVGGEHSSRIDHAMLRGCPDNWSADYARVHDKAIKVVTDEGNEIDWRLSDHYGVSAFVTVAPSKAAK